MPSSVLPLQPSKMLVAKFVALTTAWSAIARLPFFTNEPPAKIRARPRAATKAARQVENRVMVSQASILQAALDASFHSPRQEYACLETGNAGGTFGIRRDSANGRVKRLHLRHPHPHRSQ